MDKAEQAANKQLAPLIEWAKKNQGSPGKPGAFTIIAEAMTKKLGKKIVRQLVATWLHHDPKQRKQPLFGTGLVLVEVGNELTSKYEPSEPAKG